MLATIFITVFIDLLGVGIIIPILAPLFLNPMHGLLGPEYTATILTRTVLLGFLTAAYPLAQFFGAPILGALSDRFGRRKILLISQGGSLIGYVLFAIGIITKNIPLLFASRMLDGFTGGNISIAMSSIADISDQKEKARNFGLIGMAFGLGFILGPYIGGKLSDPTIVSWFTPSLPFWFAATLCFFNMIQVAFKFPETSKYRRETPVSIFTGMRNIAKAFSMGNVRTMFISIFFLTIGFNFFTQFFQVFLYQKFGLTMSQIGDLFSYIGLWIAFTQGFLTRFITRKINPESILTVSMVTLSIALMLLLVPEKLWILMCVLPFVAISNGLTLPNSTAIISNLSDKKSQGEILGINQSIQSLGMAIPPVIAGFAASIDRDLPIFLASCFILIAWLVFIFFFKKKNKETFHEV